MDYSKIRNIDCVKDNPNADLVQRTWMNYLNGESFYDFKALIYPETNNNNYTFNKYDKVDKFYQAITDNIIMTNDNKLIEEINPEIMDGIPEELL